MGAGAVLLYALVAAAVSKLARLCVLATWTRVEEGADRDAAGGLVSTHRPWKHSGPQLTDDGRNAEQRLLEFCV